MSNGKNNSINSLMDRIFQAAGNLDKDPDFWDAKEFSELKKEIKEYLKKKTNYCCAYCRRSIKGEHNMTIDIEHILEKDVVPRLTFEIDNLAVSCRRCNFKKNTITNAYTTLTMEAEYRASFTYRFIHPNLDDYFRYIKLINITINGSMMIKYLPLPKADVPIPAKAWFTYDEFDLREFERFDLMKKMGIRRPNTILAVESPSVQQFLADQFEKSHTLRKRNKEERVARKNNK